MVFIFSITIILFYIFVLVNILWSFTCILGCTCYLKRRRPIDAEIKSFRTAVFIQINMQIQA